MEKNEETTGETAAELVPAPQLRYRIAFFVTALVVLGLIVTLPFSVKTVVDDVLGPATGRVIQLISHSGPPEPNHVNLHLAITSIDEVQLFATIRLSGHYVCAGCAWSHRVLLVAITSDDAEAAGLPPSAGITLPADDTEISQMVQLPVRGHPIHYPFDRYDLCLGVVYQRIYPDGTQETLSEAQARGHLFLSLQELLPRNTMRGPFPVDPHSIRSVGDPFAYATAFEMSFSRPPYLRFLTVLLVLLITAAAAYSVFLRPLHDLVVNAGALVLGVWGIRSILTPGNIFYITAVDLALSMVIIFLLGALTIRALMFVHDEAQMTLLRRRPRPTEGNGPPRTRSAR